MSPTDASHLVGSIYDAATGVIDWSDLGIALRDTFRSGLCNMLVLPGGRSAPTVLGSAGFPERAQADYVNYFHQLDPWLSSLPLLGLNSPHPRNVLLGPEMIADDRLCEGEFYRDFARHLGAFHSMCSGVDVGSAGIMAVSLFRPEGSTGFGEDDRRTLNTLLPHFNRAVVLRQQLATAQAAQGLGQAVLDALTIGVAVVDSSLRVILSNVALEQLARRLDGVRLRRAGPVPGAATYLGACKDDDQNRLASLVSEAARGGAGRGLRFARSGQALPIAALVMPVPARLAAAAPNGSSLAPNLALVLLRDLDARAMPATPWLGTLFGLTEAEATVAVAAVNGATAEAIAVERGTSALTVRKQLRAILEKTNAANLRELTRIFSVLPEKQGKSV